MAIENVQQLLTEQLGKHRCDVISTTAMTGKKYYAIHFPVDSNIATISASNIQEVTGSTYTNLQEKDYAAGTTLFLQVTAIQLNSGIAICYYEDVI
jgi:hypothetical protein